MRDALEAVAAHPWATVLLAVCLRLVLNGIMLGLVSMIGALRKLGEAAGGKA